MLAYHNPLRRDQVDGASSLFDGGHHTLVRVWFKSVRGMTRATGWWGTLSFHLFNLSALTVIPWDSWERKKRDVREKEMRVRAKGDQLRLSFWDHADLGIWIHGCDVDEDYHAHEALLDWSSLQKREMAGEGTLTGKRINSETLLSMLVKEGCLMLTFSSR